MTNILLHYYIKSIHFDADSYIKQWNRTNIQKLTSMSMTNNFEKYAKKNELINNSSSIYSTERIDHHI